ncbi:MAG: RtcB family protein [Candidatus Thermoplasmatota archaeon]|nr:RtcB family protein [Candidatus Thermoplasmatota archaeon]
MIRKTEFTYQLPKSYSPDMRTDGLVYTSSKLLEHVLREEALQQVANVASLPGIVGDSMAMPDIHWGYGFPIGGVAATDMEDGVISPGGVGYDINCGVRMLATELTLGDVEGRIKALADDIYSNVPSGLGSKGRVRVSREMLDDVLNLGAVWTVENGYGFKGDLERLEENGNFEDADPSVVGERAKRRGMPQLGSLGAGNHFLEIQKVSEIIDPKAAKVFHLNDPDQIVVMIHTGSRGCGYQICQDQIDSLSRNFRKEGRYFVSDKYGIKLPDRQLVCAPLQSVDGKNYFKAMKCAANYAWANRQMITHWIRDSFQTVLGRDFGEIRMDIIYDVAHNIAKQETYEIEGEKRELVVHRKGATRSLGPGNRNVTERYRDIGQPVIIPGDMGTASFLLRGTVEAEKSTFGSTCHGAGRLSSRSAARKRFRGREVINELAKKGIYVRAHSEKVAAEEAPQVYKDIEEVVNVTHGAGISMKVAKMKPLAVVKG